MLRLIFFYLIFLIIFDKIYIQEVIIVKKKKELETWEIARKIRGDWGNIKPTTRIIPNKKKNTKPKHKNRQYEN